MTIYVLNRLRNEHRNIKGLLNILRRQLNSITHGDRPDYYLMYDIIHYLTYYPGRYHHRLEDLLLTRLAQLRPNLSYKVDKAEEQHRHIAHAGNRLRNLISDIIDGHMVSRDLLSRAGIAYINDYDEHLKTEEDELFGILYKVLKPVDWMLLDSTHHWQSDPALPEEAYREYKHLQEYITAGGAGSWPWNEAGMSSCSVCSTM